MRWQIEPMARWPYPETKGRKLNPFRSRFDQTLDLLETELQHLKVTGAVAVRVVAAEADIRRDGMLRARANVWHPGVALSFHSAKAGALAYPCDRFYGYSGDADWQVNLRAIALGLEALRKLDRYGIAGRGEQYTGWRAIEPGPSNRFATADEAIRWLRELVGEPLPASCSSGWRPAVAERCRPETVIVDGEPLTVVVRGEQQMDDVDRKYLAELVAATQRHVRAQPRHRAIDVLLAHQRDGPHCRCGKRIRLDQQHAGHVVDELATAGLLIEEAAKGDG